jgi:hypothetical protein
MVSADSKTHRDGPVEAIASPSVNKTMQPSFEFHRFENHRFFTATPAVFNTRWL